MLGAITVLVVAACSGATVPAATGRPQPAPGANVDPAAQSGAAGQRHPAPGHADRERSGAPPSDGTGDDRRSGPVDVLLADSATVVWRADAGPSLFAAPVVVGSVVVVAGGDGRIRAISVDRGRRQWQRRLEGPLRSLAHGGALLFTGADRENGHGYAVRLVDGSPQWTRRLGTVRHAPALAGDTLWVATDAGVHALEAESGAMLWSAELRAPVASPLLVGPEVLVATRADTLYHLDRATGRVTARSPLPGRVSATPLAWGGVLLVPLHSGRLLAYDAGARTTRWSAELDAPILASPVHTESGGAYVLTGSAELWHLPAGAEEPRRVADLDGAATGSLAVSGDHAIVGRLDGELIVVRPDGTIAWRQRLDDSIVAPVAVAGGAIYAPLLRGTLVKLEAVR